MTQCINSTPALDRSNFEEWANQSSLLEHGLDLSAQCSGASTTSRAGLHNSCNFGTWCRYTRK